MAASARDVPARLIAKIVIVAVATLVALYLLYLVRSVIGLLLISAFFALAIAPIVNRLHRRGLPRSLAILGVYLAIGASIFGVGLLLVPPVVSGVNSLSQDLPGYVDDLRSNKTFARYDDKYHITQKLREQSQQLPSKLGDAAGTLRDVTVNAFAQLVALFTILVLSFFLLMEGDRILGFLYHQLSEEREIRVRKVADDLSNAISGYAFGNLVISIVAGSVTFVTLTLLNVPFAVPLAIMFAFFDLIPLVGATLGGIIIGIVVAFVDFPRDVIIWAIVLFAYQQIENYLIQPMIYGRTVEIHPLTVFVAILIGAALLGMLGALIAIPVAAGIQSVALDVYRYSDFGKAQAMARHEKVKRRAQIGPDPPEQEPA
ncbi:MAG: hypothetical protein QOG26_896 [Solirubrobacterales bacterium]|nr:hypothetical protein [Solirubrobacterales bacterium]MDX6651506.1 hypothetical protein [Solirubrobacterales bacterium]